jgi:cytochrome c-type biogenesis protein
LIAERLAMRYWVLTVALAAIACVFALGAAADENTPPATFDQFLAGVAAANADDGSLPFSSGAFAKAQDTGGLIVVHVNAFWCSTCGVQRSALADILAQLKQTPVFSDLAVFTVDFDNQKDLVRQFGVRSQGTLIVFRGHREIGRSLGDTNEAAIRALLTEAKDASGRNTAPVLSGSSYFFALMAGLLSALSPCVLPLLPIVMGGAAAAHRLGSVALAGGFAVSFVAIGLFVGAIGFGIGLGQETIRLVAAALMIVFGFVLLSAFLQERLALAESRLESVADRSLRWLAPSGMPGQFLAGVLLGAVWSPCVGPTLGAAITLAGTRATIGQVALTMLFFALGVAIPLGAIGLVSRQALLRWRRRIEIADHVAKSFLGAVLVVVGGVILVGADRSLETLLLRLSPVWLTKLATLY